MTLLDPIEYAIQSLPGIGFERRWSGMEPFPRLRITLDEGHPAGSVFDVVNALYTGEPRIALGESLADQGILFVNPMSLEPWEAEAVGKRLREVLGG
ncbi:MAG: hypothetical protein ACR2J8_10115, partial [Thermomicrobiales bacterium]